MAVNGRPSGAKTGFTRPKTENIAFAVFIEAWLTGSSGSLCESGSPSSEPQIAGSDQIIGSLVTERGRLAVVRGAKRPGAAATGVDAESGMPKSS